MWNRVRQWTWFRDVLFSQRFWLGYEPVGRPHPELSVTVVVPAWNEEDCIADTIRGLQAQTYDIKIIVVDDCSTDSTGDIARSMGVRVIRPDSNTGTKTQALNVALPEVDTDLFICVDADTQLEPRAIYELVKSFADPKVAVASGLVISKNSSNFWETSRGAEYLCSQSVVKAAQNNANCVLVASGCFMAVRTDLLREFGGYKERTMAEDMDLTWEFIEAGYRVDFNQKAICRVIDPHNWYTYHKQVGRWYHGFAQCIKVRKFDLFSKNPKLGIIAYGYAMFSMLGPAFFLATAPIVIYSQGFLVLLYLMLFYLSIFWAAAAYQCLLCGESVWRLTRSIPAMFVSAYLTYGIYMTVLFKEFILNKSLKTWVKGH